jgi:hypothetical protein
MTQGRWFVKNLIHSEDVPNMETLKEKLRNNDTKFIEKLQYFARFVPGSDSYWRNKRAELVSWIGHHVPNIIMCIISLERYRKVAEQNKEHYWRTSTYSGQYY